MNERPTAEPSAFFVDCHPERCEGSALSSFTLFPPSPSALRPLPTAVHTLFLSPSLANSFLPNRREHRIRRR